MTYYFCRFRGYLIVVCTNSSRRAMDRLVEYVNVTKGNLGYSDREIRKDAQINTIDLVDDLGYLGRLQYIEKDIANIRQRFEKELSARESELAQIRQAIRKVAELAGSYFEDEYDF